MEIEDVDSFVDLCGKCVEKESHRHGVDIALGIDFHYTQYGAVGKIVVGVRTAAYAVHVGVQQRFVVEDGVSLLVRAQPSFSHL
jgi:hypothetical protein